MTTMVVEYFAVEWTDTFNCVLTGNAAYATKNQPICRATNSGLDTPAGFLSLTVCVLLAFIIICILMVCCITRCRWVASEWLITAVVKWFLSEILCAFQWQLTCYCLSWDRQISENTCFGGKSAIITALSACIAPQVRWMIYWYNYGHCSSGIVKYSARLKTFRFQNSFPKILLWHCRFPFLHFEIVCLF